MHSVLCIKGCLPFIGLQASGCQQRHTWNSGALSCSLAISAPSCTHSSLPCGRWMLMNVWLLYLLHTLSCCWPCSLASPPHQIGLQVWPAHQIHLPKAACLAGYNAMQWCASVAHEWLWLAAKAQTGTEQDQRDSSDKEQSSRMHSHGSVNRATALDKSSANVAGATGLGTQLSSVAGPTLQVRSLLIQPLAIRSVMWTACAV